MKIVLNVFFMCVLVLTGYSEEPHLFPIYVDGLGGYIDKTGIPVIPPQYSSVKSFSDGVALVEQNDSYFIIDKNGSEAVRLQCDYYIHYADYFYEGLAKVRTSNGVIFFNCVATSNVHY